MSIDPTPPRVGGGLPPSNEIPAGPPSSAKPIDALAVSAAESGNSTVLRRLVGSRTFTITALTVVIVILFAVTQPRFLTSANVELLLLNVSVLFVVAIGLTFVLLVGGFDLSIGTLLALSGFFLAWAYTDAGLPIVVAMMLTVVFGGVVGAATNGLLIGRFKANFMVVTLGTMTLFAGLTHLVSGGSTESIASDFLVDVFSYGRVAGIPIPVVTAFVAFGLAHYVLKYTLFGRDVYASGGNPQAARLGGISVTRTTVVVYAIAGAAAALGAVIQSSRTGSAGPTVGDAVMLQAAAAVLIGGTSLRGGSGSVVGTAIGVLFFGVLSNGLLLAGYGTEWQQIISGLIVASAAVMDKIQRDGWESLGIRLRRPSVSYQQISD